MNSAISRFLDYIGNPCCAIVAILVIFLIFTIKYVVKIRNSHDIDNISNEEK